MYRDIEEYIATCHTCQMRGQQKKNNELSPIEPTGPWERVGIDFVGPLDITPNGNRYIITAIDYFTRWPEAKAVPNATAEVTAKFIYKDIICRHGIVDIIHTDQGTHFVNELITKLAERFQMKHHKITAYHPQANGLVERFNGTLKRTLSKIVEEPYDWDKYIAPALFAYRTSKVETIGVAPSFLEFGRTLRLPKECKYNESVWERIQHMVDKVPMFRKTAKQTIKKAQEKMIQSHKVKQVTFQIGDLVTIEKSHLGEIIKTLGPKREEPLEIIKVYSHGTYVLRNKDGTPTKAINGDRLKLYKRRKFQLPIVVVEQ